MRVCGGVSNKDVAVAMVQVHSNAQKSRSLVIKILAEDAEEKGLQDYVTECVGKLYPVPHDIDGNNMPCCVVGTSVNVSSNLTSDNNTLHVYVIYRAWGETANDIVGNSLEDKLIITKEVRNSRTHLLDPNEVADAFQAHSPRRGIRVIGISGTSEEYAAKLWAEIVSDNRTWMGGEGGGSGIHPMSLYCAETETVFYTQECSYEFQWNAYASVE